MLNKSIDANPLNSGDSALKKRMIDAIKSHLSRPGAMIPWGDLDWEEIIGAPVMHVLNRDDLIANLTEEQLKKIVFQ